MLYECELVRELVRVKTRASGGTSGDDILMGPLFPEASNRGQMRSIDVLRGEIWGWWIQYTVIGYPYRFHDMVGLVYSPYQHAGLVGLNSVYVPPRSACKWVSSSTSHGVKTSVLIKKFCILCTF